MMFQEQIEAGYADDAGHAQHAPQQRMLDFVNSKPSSDLPETSYAPGIHPARMDKLLPKGIARRLQAGFKDFDKKNRGFLTNEAVLIGAETRTSSPVRIPRDPSTLLHIHYKGLFPCGVQDMQVVLYRLQLMETEPLLQWPTITVKRHRATPTVKFQKQNRQ